uniref:Uncharacterized protein n=1 Tax=viral metagenome TaxID=1070528 RepID=A0A6M3L2M2_9ZZZZ
MNMKYFGIFRKNIDNQAELINANVEKFDSVAHAKYMFWSKISPDFFSPQDPNKPVELWLFNKDPRRKKTAPMDPIHTLLPDKIMKIGRKGGIKSIFPHHQKRRFEMKDGDRMETYLVEIMVDKKRLRLPYTNSSSKKYLKSPSVEKMIIKEFVFLEESGIHFSQFRKITKV